MKQLFYKKWKLSVGINTKTDVFIYVDYLYLSDIKRKYIIADMCKINSSLIYRMQQWYQSAVIALLRLRKSASQPQGNHSTVNPLLWRHKF